jgi:hypothetical protein
MRYSWTTLEEEETGEEEDEDDEEDEDEAEEMVTGEEDEDSLDEAELCREELDELSGVKEESWLVPVPPQPAKTKNEPMTPTRNAFNFIYNS